jgi:hypothetical protein
MLASLTLDYIVPVALGVVSIPAVLLIFFAAEERKKHDWRRCPLCLQWFDQHGSTRPQPPLTARFGIHRDGVCQNCRAAEAVAEEEESSGFAA